MSSSFLGGFLSGAIFMLVCCGLAFWFTDVADKADGTHSSTE